MPDPRKVQRPGQPPDARLRCYESSVLTRRESKEVVMRIEARYSAFGLYETAVLGTLAQCSGWAAARRIVDAASPIPVIGFGARHVHPSVADQMDYASVVGGCIGASTPAGARMAGLSPTGTGARPGPDLRRHGAGGRRSTATSIRTCPGSSWSTPSRTRRRNRSAWRALRGAAVGGVRLGTLRGVAGSRRISSRRSVPASTWPGMAT